MKLCHVMFVLAAAASSSGLLGCTAESSPAIQPSRPGAVSYTSASSLPSCNASADLNVAYVAESDAFVVCFEGAWHALGQRAPGKDGKDGAEGARGPQGFAGATGFEGKSGKDGKDGEDGEDGADGAAGTNGHSALVEMHDEPPGPNCEHGGVAITVGLDYNDNGELDEFEGKTSYACHGGPKPPAPPPACMPIGSACTSGGECCSDTCSFPSSSDSSEPTSGTCAEIH